jgi:hypothetical protein
MDDFLLYTVIATGIVASIVFAIMTGWALAAHFITML